MKNLVKSVIILSTIVTFLIAGNSIKAINVPGNVSDIGPTSKAWLSTSYQDMILYPQTTIKMNDSDVNASNEQNGAKKIRVKAITDGKNISFLIKWVDKTKSVQDDYNLTAYGDGYAMQFPTSYKDVNKLPYIGMGSNGRSVVIHLQKATGDIDELNKNNKNEFEVDLLKYTTEPQVKTVGAYKRVFISEGFRSMIQIKNGSVNGKMQMLYKNGYWRGTLSRSLKSSYLDLDKGAFPIAFALWDGGKNNRDDIKLLSSWIGVKIIGKNGGQKLINTLMSEAKGDISNGKKIALENCAACHQYKDVNIAPDFMAPNLSNIGGYSTKEYLMESLVDPSAVVVEGYSSDTHKNFTWYNIDDKGNRVSVMPSYDWLDQKRRDDLVAFFKTLKAEVE